jgi:hypothetical protein
MTATLLATDNLPQSRTASANDPKKLVHVDDDVLTE